MKLITSQLLFAVLLAMGSACYAQSPKEPAHKEFYPAVPKVAEPARRAQQQPPAASGNPISQSAIQQGAVKCGEKITQFTDFLSAGGLASAHLFVAPSLPDRRVVSTSMEVQSGQAVSYVGASFAPDGVANHCSGVYEAVTYWQNTCDEVARGPFATFKVANPIRQAVRTLEGGPTVRVYLLPAGVGCVSIKKEINF